MESHLGSLQSMFIPREHYIRLREIYTCFKKAGFSEHCRTLVYIAKILREIDENEVKNNEKK